MAVDIARFIDIHVHILPGIDDGAKSLEASTAIAEVYVSNGITRLIATPHFIPGTSWAAGREKIAGKIEELHSHLVKHGIDLEIYPGMEIAYHKKMINRLEKDLLQPLGKSNSYLLEPSFRDASDDLLRCAKRIMDTGCGVILAHPERIPSFQETAEPLVELVEKGLQIQMNMGSLLDKFGESSKRLATLLLDADCVHYLASDAHSVESRRPIDREGWQVLNDLLGDQLLTQLCITNPQDLLLDSGSHQ